MNPDVGLGPEVHIELNSPDMYADYGFSYAAFGFAPMSYFILMAPNNIFMLTIHPTPGVRIFSVQENDTFTLQGIQSNIYTEEPSSSYMGLPVMICEEGDKFYLGFYTGWPYDTGTGLYDNPVLGWGLFENVGGVIQMLDSGLEYGGEGIKIGTLDIINIPEPTTCALFLFGLAGFLGFRKRVHSKKS